MLEGEFQGEKVELRRLGLSDIFEVQRIANEVIAGAGLRGVFLGGDDGTFQDQLMAVLFTGAEFSEKRITDWIKSLFIPAYDKPIFLPGVPELIGILKKHPDIEAFLKSGEKVFKDLFAQMQSQKEEVQPETQD